MASFSTQASAQASTQAPAHASARAPPAMGTAKKLVLAGLGLGMLSVVGGEMPGATFALPYGYAEGARLRSGVDAEGARLRGNGFAKTVRNWVPDAPAAFTNGPPSTWEAPAVSDTQIKIKEVAAKERSAKDRASAKKSAVRTQDYDQEVQSIVKEKGLGDNVSAETRGAIKEAIIVGEEKLYTFEHDLAKKWESIWSFCWRIFLILVFVYMAIVANNNGEWLPCATINAHVLDANTGKVGTGSSSFCIGTWGNGADDGNCFDGSSSSGCFEGNVEFATDGFVGGASGVQTVTFDPNTIADTAGEPLLDPLSGSMNQKFDYNTGLVALPSYASWSTQALPSNSYSSSV